MCKRIFLRKTSQLPTTIYLKTKNQTNKTPNSTKGVKDRFFLFHYEGILSCQVHTLGDAQMILSFNSIKKLSEGQKNENHRPNQ